MIKPVLWSYESSSVTVLVYELSELQVKHNTRIIMIQGLLKKTNEIHVGEADSAITVVGQVN